MAPDTFPPGAPVVNGQEITVEQFLANPARVQRALQDLTLERFVADQIYTPGPAATGGAVIYDQILGNELYGNRDVQAIEPGSEFPIIDLGEVSPLVARTVKWGGASELTYEERDRDRRDVLGRKILRIRNTVVRKVDQVAVATLRAAPVNNAVASGDWGIGTTAIFKDVAAVQTMVDRLDLGYAIDSAIISPNTNLSMVTNDTLLNQLPRESAGANASPIVSGALAGLAGIRKWFVTNRVTDDEVFFTSGRMAGSISDEKPLYSRVVDRQERESLFIMAARLVVPYVTDPKSVVRLVGVNG